MAEVHKARTLGAEGVSKTLVIKRILPELATDKRFVELFIAEARLAMDLNHPNIVQVYDFGKVDEVYYLAMEYVDGVHLGRLMDAARQCSHPVGLGNAIYIATEIAKGLDYAHGRIDEFGRPMGLIHRDISPQNIMIGRQGAVKLLDFGIAQRADERSGEDERFVGKVRYMSPEQSRGEALDQRSDLFSLGTVLYEMVTGSPLFDATDEATARKLVRSAVIPDLGSIVEVPEELEFILYKLLSADREQRMESARQLQTRLTRVLYGLAQIYDGTTLAQYVAELSDKWAELEREKGLFGPNGTGELENRRQEPITAVTGLVNASEGAELGGIPSAPSGVSTRQRKDVTLICGEVRGGGGKGQGADESFEQIIESIAYKYDAVIHRLEGWRFCLMMGIPMATATDATRAAQVALLVREAVEGLRLGEDDKPVVQVPMAIGKGEVLLESVGGQEDGFAWELRDGAQARLEAVVELLESEIALDSAVRARIERRYRSRELALEAPDHPGGLYALQAPKSVGEQIRELRRSFEQFHGREMEQKIMRNRLRATLMEGQARGLIWMGEAGVGKSTLIEGFLEQLNLDEVRLIRGVATPAHRDVPLASVRALFGEIMGLELGGDRATLEQRLRDYLKAAFGASNGGGQEMIGPFLGLFGLRQGEGRTSRRQELFAALNRVVNREARRKPLVVAIDDIEFMDPVMMHFAARYFDERPGGAVFFVGTTRGEREVKHGRVWKKLLEAQGIRVERLPELSQRSAEELVRGLLVMEEEEVDEQVVQRLVERSGGNPLYIQEVVQSWITGGQEARADRELPSSLESILAARLDRMNAGERAALQQLVILPEPFTADMAKEALGVQKGPIEDLVEERILEVADPHGKSYRFASDLLRRAARRGVLDDDRVQAHRRVAEYLKQHHERYGGVVVAEQLELAGQLEEALQWYEGAIEEACTQWGAEQCLQICDQLLEKEWLDGAGRRRVLRWKVTSLREVGVTREWKQALDEWSSMASEEEIGEPRLRAMAEEVRFDRQEGRLAEARQKAQELAAMANEHGHRHFQALAWRLEAVIDLSEGRRHRALGLVDRAIGSLHRQDRSQDQRLLIECYSTRGVILRQSGRHREALEAYQTALLISESMPSTTLHRQLLINSGLAHAYLGEFARAKESYRQALAACRRMGHRRDEALVWVNLGHLYQMLGRGEQSLECTWRGLAQARRAEDVHTEVDGLITLGLAHLELNQLEEANTFLKEGLGEAKNIPHIYMMVCAMLGLVQWGLRRGGEARLKEAKERAEHSLELSQKTGLMWAEVMAQYLLSEIAKRRGERRKALEWSALAVKGLDGLELFGEDAVLVGRAELLDDGDEEGRELLQRAWALTQRRLEQIDEAPDLRAFQRREVVRKLKALRQAEG